VAKFCIGCGASLAGTYPSCRTSTPPGARFCMECGTALLIPAEAPSLPPAVLAGRKRKHITALFADVAGSMDLQERLDPEVCAQIMGRFVSIPAKGVRKFGGTVDKFTGDGMMALFGAPVAQEDHARRACHAARHLTKVIGRVLRKAPMPSTASNYGCGRGLNWAAVAAHLGDAAVADSSNVRSVPTPGRRCTDRRPGAFD
jgi:class 3 adenylate cyclase